jgi:glycosyltransferase involved in cell wall biosynthesis
MKPFMLTVIIVCFNAHNTLKRAIDNVLGQTYADFEIIVVDGGGSDETVEILKGYSVNINH